MVRIITFSPYLCHTDPIFKDLNLLPISKLVTQRIGLLMFKYSIHSLPSVIEDLFTCNTSVSNHNTRNKSKLRQPRSNCEYMYRNISFTGVYIWNKIQDHINVYSTYSTFKDALKSFLLVHEPTIESYKCSFVNKITYTVFLYVIIYLIFVVS